jgi:hypothetical protein
MRKKKKKKKKKKRKTRGQRMGRRTWDRKYRAKDCTRGPSRWRWRWT